jgi:hypothetical protein
MFLDSPLLRTYSHKPSNAFFMSVTVEEALPFSPRTAIAVKQNIFSCVSLVSAIAQTSAIEFPFTALIQSKAALFLFGSMI